jgi:hypothetical protein
MPTKRIETRMPNEIPMEPFYYSFLLDSIPDDENKRCVKAALDKYNKTCMRAYKLLIKELKRCKKSTT